MAEIKNDIVACFPQWGNYSYAFKFLFERGFGVKYLTPPPITKRTLNLGSKYSPDYVCAPFKYCLGCYIEALEQGANCLMQIFGACRLNYYGELAEQILHDLGYQFHFFNMANISWLSPKSIVANLKVVNPEVSLVKVVKALPTTLTIIEVIDQFDDFVRHNIGFEATPGSFDQISKEFFAKLDQITNKKEVKRLWKVYRKRLKQVPLNKPAHTLKVGMVGDYYTVQEPFSNYFIEKELAKMGMEIYREMNLTNTLIHNKWRESEKIAKKYAKYNLGATANFTVAEAIKFARQKMDGIIQVKSFGCTPEIDAMPILQNVSNDFKVPILHFSFDSQTSETGVKTRLEAFYDMVVAKKEERK